jgi:hypothetical protein
LASLDFFLLHLTDPPIGAAVSFDSSLLRDAQSHFERSLILDPENVVSQAFLEKVGLVNTSQTPSHIRLATDSHLRE